jgi:hypothetical protein
MEAVHIMMRTNSWRERFVASPRVLRWTIYYGLVLVTLSFSRLGEEGFIYGQFLRIPRDGEQCFHGIVNTDSTAT